MVRWENLYSNEKQKLLNKAKEYLDNGLYQGFDIEELAILLHNRNNGDNNER